MSMKTFKYRLYPTKKQAEKLQWTLDHCRELYNAALQERKDAWNVAKRHPNYYDLRWRKDMAQKYSVSYLDQQNSLPEIKRVVRTEYQEIGAHVLQDTLKRVDKAFQSFFRRIKSGQTPGYPRFQGKNRYNSFTYPDHIGWKIGESQLVLSKIGHVKVKWHRSMKGIVKTVTIKREEESWYVCFACEVEAEKKLPYTDLAIGIDLGVLHLATLSCGDTIEHPRYYRKMTTKLVTAQQALARKKRGSHRRKKAVQKVAKCHWKVHNQRQDFLHKQSRMLVSTYETIVFEDLQAANMTKRPKPKQDAETGTYLPNKASAKAGLNKSILDAGWAMFTAMVSVKAESAGCSVIFVNPFKTSQICSTCLKEGPRKDLSERTHTCTHCGIVLDRDHNAALVRRFGA